MKKLLFACGLVQIGLSVLLELLAKVSDQGFMLAYSPKETLKSGFDG